MKVNNIAHRGFSGKYPENTMLAFEKAIEAGCDGIEFDVQLTKDGIPVIIHDETIDRTTNGTGYVCDYTYEELSKFDASFIYEGVYGVNPIPTLEMYFELVKDKKLISNIELKTGVFEYEGIEDSVLELIARYQLHDQVIISSFNHFTIKRIKALAPKIICGFLTESWLIDAGHYTKAQGIECYHPIFWNLSHEVVAELKAHDIAIHTWTVNTKEAMLDLIEKGVDSIITNYPDVLYTLCH